MASNAMELAAKAGKARTGMLRMGTAELNFPAALVYTRRGGAVNLTPDVLATLGSSADHLCVNASDL